MALAIESVSPSLVAERHPMFNRILEAFASQTDPEIAAWAVPPVNRTTIWRWRKKYAGERLQVAEVGSKTVAATVARALQREGLLIPQAKPNQTLAVATAATKAALEADPFIERAISSSQRRERWMAAVELEKDYRTLSALDRNDLTAQEYHARLAGRLDTNTGASVTINISIPGAGSVAVQAAEGGGPIIDID